ncbi:MAG: hypothetical protein ACSLFO_05840 [Acidimicrobiales bacterium]
MTTGEPEADEIRRQLDDLARMHLRPSEWAATEEELRTVANGAPDPVQHVSQVVFEAKIKNRFQAGRARSTLPPTKQTSVLPWVGLVCGALLLAVGGALGGGPVLVGVALLGVFVFGIAMAGSRVTNNRPSAGRSTGGPEPEEPATPMPPSVVAVVEHLRSTDRG